MPTIKSKKIPEEQKDPSKRMYMKPKAGNSFSIVKRRSCSTTMTRKHHSQEKKWRRIITIETDTSSSTSTKSSTSVVGETENEIMEIAMGSIMDDDDEWETDTSIEKMRSAELTSVDESVIPPPESFRDKDIASLVFLSESYCPIAYSTPLFSSDGKSFPFSVKFDSLKEAVPHASPTMKSDVVTRHEERPTIPNVSFENEFVKEKDTLEDEDFQLKPISPEKNLELPDIPDDVIQETQEQREDEDVEMKSISPEQSVQLPVVPDNVSYENQEKSEGRLESNEREYQIKIRRSPFKKRDDGERRDSITYPEVPFSDGSDISQDSNASTVPNFKEDPILSPFKKHDGAERRDSIADIEVPYSGGSDISQVSDVSTVPNFEEDKEYNENNPFEAVIIKSINSNSRNRKQEDEAGNSFEDIDDYSNGEDFGKFRNLKIDSSMEKGKSDRVKNRINESITRWRQRNEGVNLLEYKSDSEDNFENVQKIRNTELEDNELFNNQPQTVAPQLKSGVKVSAGVDKKRQQEKGTSFLNRSQNSISLRKKHTKDSKHLFEDKNKNGSEDSSETIQNVQNEEFQDYELVNNQRETSTHQKKTNNRIKFASTLSRSTNSKKKIKNGNKKGNSSEGVNNYNRVDNFEKDETPKRKGTVYKRIKLKFSKRIKTPHRRKYRNEGGNSFKDKVKNGSEDSFETDQNEQNEELQDYELDNNQPETSTYQTNRKINKYVGADNITQRDDNILNRSQSSLSLKKKHKNEGENLFEVMDKTDSENSFENFQNVEHEELQDDELDHNIPETSAHQTKRKNNIHLGADNMTQKNTSISNRSQSSAHLRRKHNNGENSFGDLDKRDNVKSSKNIQKNRNDRDKVGHSSEDTYDRIYDFEEDNMEVNTSKKKRKPYRSVGIKRNRHVNRSRKAANSLSRSRNSTSREVSVDLQNRENEAENTNWPRCCIEALSYFGRTFRVLSPVFHDDYPIDSITLLNYGLMGSQKECKH